MDWQDMEDLLANSENNCLEDNKLFDHDDLSDKLKKTFYYAPHKKPAKDTLSFPLTREAVESFRKAAPSSFGKLGHRYASRVARDACITPCSLLLGMIYIERLAHRNPTYLQKISSSDLFLISMMIASKYLQDEGLDDEVFNDEWAASGLVDVDYVNDLEADFLKAIDWRVLVRQPEFRRMLYINEMRIATKQGFARGWFTYTDVQCLLCCDKLNDHIHQQIYLLVKVLCACVALYTGIFLAAGTYLMMQSTQISSGQFHCHHLNVMEYKPTQFVGPQINYHRRNYTETDTNETKQVVAQEVERKPISVELPSLDVVARNPQPKIWSEVSSVAPPGDENSIGQMGMMSMVETVFFLANVTVGCHETELEQKEICPCCRKCFDSNYIKQNLKPSLACHSCCNTRYNDDTNICFTEQDNRKKHAPPQHTHNKNDRFQPQYYLHNKLEPNNKFAFLRPGRTTVF
uniref:Protein CNPPD1 n=1 Tax=Phallusia mammillata TaxID=59560 RepID=A0A6F9DAG0_9ASCI|nr:protein CNPPD1 [Phallusia mammillata]